jgi:spermidine/putrescine transport system ATP-binding protein
MAQVAVELQDVTKRYGAVVAVDSLSLQIRDGEFFSLLGPSGCGKTTTLRMIAGLETPTEGSLRIHGIEMGDRPAFQRPVNTVFQSYALFPHMSVAENIAFGLKMKKVPGAEIAPRVDEALRMVRLEGFGDRRPRQLSGGQQQRVALARALINRPQVLLLDEPLGALDLKLRKEMQLELKHLRQQVGITFIYVTHDQEEALVMSDRIAVMHQGHILQVGTPTEIYERPTTRFVADFIGETNFLKGTLTSVSGELGAVRLEGGVEVTGRAPASHNGDAVSLSVRPEKIRISDDSLEGRPNAFRVRVADVAYVGSDTRIRIRMVNGAQLDVWEPNNLSTVDKDAYYAPGDEAWIAWEPYNALILGE